MTRLKSPHVLCRRDNCGRQLGLIYGPGTGLVLALIPGYQRDVDDLFTFSTHARQRQRYLDQGRSGSIRGKGWHDKPYGTVVGRYPARVRCYRCRLVQPLDAAALGLRDRQSDDESVAWNVAEVFAGVRPAAEIAKGAKRV